MRFTRSVAKEVDHTAKEIAFPGVLFQITVWGGSDGLSKTYPNTRCERTLAEHPILLLSAPNICFQ
jgi:hypothetical protein